MVSLPEMLAHQTFAVMLQPRPQALFFGDEVGDVALSV